MKTTEAKSVNAAQFTPSPWHIEDGVIKSANGSNVSGCVVSRMKAGDARLIAAAPSLFEALFGCVFARLGDRMSPQGFDKWKIWADQYRNDPKVDAPLLRGVDAIAKATEGAQ